MSSCASASSAVSASPNSGSSRHRLSPPLCRSGSPRPSTSIEPSQRKKSGSSCVRVARSRRSRPSFGPACVQLVRKDDAVLVRLDAERGDESLAAPAHAVRALVVLREPPVRRLGVLDEHAALAPVGELRRGLLLAVGKGQVDDVVRARSAELLALLRPDDVVRRRDERVERSCHSLVVAERAERPYRCHGNDRTNRTVSFPRANASATVATPSRTDAGPRRAATSGHRALGRPRRDAPCSIARDDEQPLRRARPRATADAGKPAQPCWRVPELELRRRVTDRRPRDDALDRPAPAAGEREADAVREPVPRDGARGGRTACVWPSTTAIPASGPPPRRMRNSVT